MATDADTLPVDTDVATREASRPPRTRNGALTWAAIAGAGIAVDAPEPEFVPGSRHMPTR
jgi:hypothetical protein